MITEKIIREQTPDVGFDWLYEEQVDGVRNFVRKVLLGNNATEWMQCTNEEKLAWEEAHKPEEPKEEALEQ